MGKAGEKGGQKVSEMDETKIGGGFEEKEGDRKRQHRDSANERRETERAETIRKPDQCEIQSLNDFRVSYPREGEQWKGDWNEENEIRRKRERENLV